MGEYDDKFEDVMEYVEMQLNDEGVRVQVRSEEDLKALIINMDRVRARQRKREPRISQTFLDRAVNSGAASSAVRSRRIYGLRGRLANIKGGGGGGESLPPTTVIVPNARPGAEVYSYSKGYATKDIQKSRAGTVRIVFRDVKTGRFVSKKQEFKNV